MLLLSSDLRWQWTTTRLNSFDNLMFDVWFWHQQIHEAEWAVNYNLAFFGHPKKYVKRPSRIYSRYIDSMKPLLAGAWKITTDGGNWCLSTTWAPPAVSLFINPFKYRYFIYPYIITHVSFMIYLGISIVIHLHMICIYIYLKSHI